MFKLILMLTCIGKAITTAVINPNITCDLIKEPVLLIRNDSTNQHMLLNPSSNDVTSAIKVHLDDYKGNARVQQTRNTLIIFFWNDGDYMMKVHNLITGRSNGGFSFVDDPNLARRSAFFTLADTIYFAKYYGGFMEYNKALNKFIESNTITLPGYQPDFIVEIEHRPCFVVPFESHLQFNCYHSDQNKWKVRAKWLSAPSDSWIRSAQVYHNQIFICYLYSYYNDQCIVYNIKTGKEVKQTDEFQTSYYPNWYDIRPTGVVTVGGQYYVVSNINKQFLKIRLSDKEWKILTGLTLLAIINPCISSKKTTTVQLKEQTTKSIHSSTQAEQSTKPPLTDSMESCSYENKSMKLDCIRNATSCHKYVKFDPVEHHNNQDCPDLIELKDCDDYEINCAEDLRPSCSSIFDKQKAEFCKGVCSNQPVVVTNTIFTSKQVNCSNYSEFKHLISSTCPKKNCSNDCQLEHTEHKTEIMTSLMKSKDHQCKPSKKIIQLTKVINYSVEGQDMIIDECPKNNDYIRSTLVHQGECIPQINSLRQKRSPCKVWSIWSQCSVSCNVGSRTRSKEIQFNGGCTKIEDTEPCMMNVCQKSITGNLCVFLKYNTSDDNGNMVEKRIKIGGNHNCTVEPKDQGFANTIYPLKKIPTRIVQIKVEKEPEISIISTIWPVMLLNGILIVTVIVMLMMAKHFKSIDLEVDTEENELIQQNETAEEMESNSPPLNIDNESKTMITVSTKKTIKKSDASKTMERVTSPPILSDPFKTESVTTLELDTLVSSKVESSIMNGKVSKENGKSILTSKKKSHAYPSITKKSTGTETSWIKVQLSDGKSIEEPIGNQYIKVIDIPNEKTKVIKSKSGSD